MKVIYLDSLIITELAADFMLLLATDRFCAAGVSWKRLLAASAVGAVYSVLYVLLGSFWGGLLMKLIFAVLMLLVAFGKRKDLARCGAVFALCSAAFAGIVLAVSLCCGGFGAKQMLFSFAAAYALMGGILRFSAAKGGGTVRAVIRNRGRSISLTVLRDTGSSLRDPVSGAAALIAGEEQLLPLLEDEVCAALRASRGRPPEERLEQLWQKGLGRGFKLLPYSAVGVENGLLLAFRVEAAEIGGRKLRGMVAAMTPGEVAPDGGFSAIVNADV
ncbi:MAG: sigma-E processing peptidase SpoIIGA [Clostridiales bacterium]|nr:sigma-E processing peptidase SpoIIGA [Clostridiales bacterium]